MPPQCSWQIPRGLFVCLSGCTQGLQRRRGSPRATGSVTELEEVPPLTSRFRSRSVRMSPPPSVPEIRLVGESASLPGAGKVSLSSAGDEGVPSDAAVQSAVPQLIAPFEAARQAGAPSGRREVEHLEDAPRNRRGRPMQGEFVPALWGGVRQSSLRAVRLGRTPRR